MGNEKIKDKIMEEEYRKSNKENGDISKEMEPLMNEIIENQEMIKPFCIFTYEDGRTLSFETRELFEEFFLKKSDVETFTKSFIKTLKQFSEKYGYYYDEEDSVVEECFDNKTNEELIKYGIKGWSNDRMVVPIEVIEKMFEEQFKNKLLKGDK